MPSHDRVDIWLRPERSGVGPKPEHSRAGIAAAAINIADGDGLTAVSIRRVAAGIGAGGASLYRYLKSHDELIELIVDAVSSEYDLDPSDEPPPMQLLNLARQGRAIMHRHPWLAPLLLTRPSMGPNALKYLERALSAMEPVDMPGPAKLQTVAMMTAITSAFVQNELASAASSGTGLDGANARLQYLSDVVQSGNYPFLAGALTGHHDPERPEEVFNSVITNYLAGVGLQIAVRPT
ncbi:MULTISPECIES: TetR/AcrR family transcriptional regulator C-terminal domain-containing protein [unclassified Arthrobacter]|uniref:TetR/AcrR family transcriptional regulator C-terminal domain-containing protein n=1 Tax=unclassified Arthrobacter TaxID=235627 RepID=UPI00149162A2|nr:MULTISPECIES: TetR/AcrR family transcriptional regulator C-terminal domain-containing protein [unclassified Arthrobacter]MBE0009258.1 TetR family transcriptional regulator [Arthrobacter sp. AET 35A]NOJ62932.1 TetR family transcriptional regulator [Arthrobacter sp. 147(2020)]